MVKRFSDAEWAALEAEYSAGVSISLISRKYKIDRKTIRAYAANLGWNREKAQEKALDLAGKKTLAAVMKAEREAEIPERPSEGNVGNVVPFPGLGLDNPASVGAQVVDTAATVWSTVNQRHYLRGEELFKTMAALHESIQSLLGQNGDEAQRRAATILYASEKDSLSSLVTALANGVEKAANLQRKALSMDSGDGKRRVEITGPNGGPIQQASMTLFSSMPTDKLEVLRHAIEEISSLDNDRELPLPPGGEAS